VHHSNSQFNRMERIFKPNLLSVINNLTGGWLLNAKQNFH